MMEASDSYGDLKGLSKEDRSLGTSRELEEYETGKGNQELHLVIDQNEKNLSHGYSQLGFATEEDQNEPSFCSQDDEDETVSRSSTPGYVILAGDSPPTSPAGKQSSSDDLEDGVDSAKLGRFPQTKRLPSLVAKKVRRATKRRRDYIYELNESRCTTHHSYWIGYNVFFLTMGAMILFLKNESGKQQSSMQPAFTRESISSDFHIDLDNKREEVGKVSRDQGSESAELDKSKGLSEEDFEMFEANKILERVTSPRDEPEYIPDNSRARSSVFAASMGSRHGEEMTSPIIEVGDYRGTDGILFTAEIEKYCDDDNSNPNFFIPKCLELCQPSECCFNSDISCSTDLVGCDPYVLCSVLLDYTNFARSEAAEEGGDEH